MGDNVSLEPIEQSLKGQNRYSNFQKNRREWLAAYLMILPNFIGFFIFHVDSDSGHHYDWFYQLGSDKYPQVGRTLKL